jgi:hypothetical protein
VEDFLGKLLIVALIVAAVSFLAVTWLWYVEYRGLDRFSPIGRAYARLGIYARWLGLSFGDGQTPLERGKRISREVPTDTGRPIMTITDSYIGERYGPPHDESPADENAVGTAWRTARKAFLRRKVRRWLRRPG